MTALTRILALYHRTGLRGSTRLFDVLSQRISSMHCVPIPVEGGVLYADLRLSTARGILADPTCRSGEDRVMRRFVREGHSVFDIGAHLGFYTILLSSLVGKKGTVYAFEPNPEMLPSLRKTIASLPNTDLREIALSDVSGEIELHIPEDASMASIANWTNGIGGKVHIQNCKTETIDHLIENGSISLPNFIKCDVEGAELNVFRGGARAIDRNDAPVILFELNRKAASAF